VWADAPVILAFDRQIAKPTDYPGRRRKKKKRSSACRGAGSAAGLQLRVRFVPAALLLLAIWQGLHWLSSVFLKPEIGRDM
jgi:hypothetical protein